MDAVKLLLVIMAITSMVSINGSRGADEREVKNVDVGQVWEHGGLGGHVKWRLRSGRLERWTSPIRVRSNKNWSGISHRGGRERTSIDRRW